MNAFESLDDVARVWGDWMRDMAWQVALLVVILAVLTWVWRQKSAVLLHTLWLLVLVRLVLPPAFAFPTGWAFWVLPAAGEARPAPSELPELAAQSTPLPLDAAPSDVPGIEPSSGFADAAELSGSGVVQVSSPSADERSLARASPAAPPAAATSRATRSWSSSLLLAWGGVAGTLLGLLFWGHVRVRRWVREAEPIDDPDLYSLLEDGRERLAIRRLVELRNSEACTTPVVVGFRRPVILLPKEVLSRLNSAEMRAVLMHELNHIARGDAIVNLIQGVLGALYFFHPLVWWANASLRRLREEACDELTVAALDGERRIYGEALVKVTEIFGYASPPLALGVLESKSPARARLGRILDPRLPQGAAFSWRTATAVLLLAAVLLPGAGGRTSAGPKSGDGDQASVREAQFEKRVADLPAVKADPVVAHSAPGQGAAGEKKSGAVPPEYTKPAENGPPGRAPLSPAPAAPPLDGIGPLRYRWESGKSYAYSMQIEAEEDETTEVYSGTPVYEVRSTGKEGTELVVNGRLMQSQKIHPGLTIPFGRPPRIPRPFSSFSGVGMQMYPTAEHVLHVDNRGRLLSIQGQSQLPYVLGNLSQLVIVPFPDEAQAQWEETEKTAITLKPGDDRFPFPRSPFGPFAHRDPLARPDEGQELEALEKTEYRRDEPRDNAVVIRKKYSLKTAQTHGGLPRLELTGEAQVIFDLGLRVPKSLSGKFQLSHNTETTSHRTPITISASLLNDEERARREGEAIAVARRMPLDNHGLDAVLVELTAQEEFRVQAAAARLERAEPQGRQAEVARALERLLENEENLTRQAAARALAVWCTSDSVPALINALDDEFSTIPVSALEALGKLKDKRGIPPITALIKAKKHRSGAVQALSAMGAMAEDAVLELLAGSDSEVRFDACQVLKTVGGAKSVQPLAKASHDDSDAIVRIMADRALEEIRERTTSAG